MRKLAIEKRTREQVLVELQQDSATWELFGKFKPEHQEELESIAKAGYEFAQKHFSGEASARLLINRLKEEQKNGRKNN